ncbi:hypothetical protein LG201_04480 [Methylobacillus gramineus]|uniref:hypothetical protein n=1 Tax=Methylobacillus gramineus TaxID=755169 RepID=UPI001CFFFFCA|nr:hypothetical protein [Methylobacillus gramineus]MCB5184454.1 hypothetical protein [Methylobacillus gramineus]
MPKFVLILTGALLAGASTCIFADPVADAPPAHKQKTQVPDSTSNGNYLEPQEKGADSKHDKKHEKDVGTTPSNSQKGERFKKEPNDGGTDLKQK